MSLPAIAAQSVFWTVFYIFVNCNWVGTRWQYTFTHKHPVAVHIYTQTPGGSTHLHTNNTQNITINNKTTQITNLEECWPCPVFAGVTLAFALQLRKKHGKTSVRVAEEIQSVHIIKTPTHYKTLPHTHTHTHTLQNSLKPPQYKLKQTQYKTYPNEIITI
jgi:hypothetical protein